MARVDDANQMIARFGGQSALARALGSGFVPIRKPGKLPAPVHAQAYALEYGEDRLEIHADALPAGARVLLVDDVLYTGRTTRAALDALIEWAGEAPTAILCAETLWWRCHRRLIADQLVARGGRVHHIFGDGSVEPHRLWDLSRVTEAGLVYPPEQGELGLGPPPKTG